VIPDARPRSRGKLLAEPRGCQLVDLEQRLTLRRARALLVALLELRDRDAETLRQLLHRVGESELLVELEKLDDVPSDPAAKAVEEALSRLT
jgi:hypothetical protein